MIVLFNYEGIFLNKMFKVEMVVNVVESNEQW